MGIGAALYFYGVEFGVVNEQEIYLGTIVGLCPERTMLPRSSLDKALEP